MELNLTKYLESGAFLVQKVIINRETNSLETKRGYAPIRNAELSRIFQTDYSVFEKTPKERSLLKILKKDFRKEMRNTYPEITNKEMGKKFTVHTKIHS